MEILMKEYNLDSFQDKDLYTWEEIISAIEELETDKRILEDKLKELEQDIESNYKRITVAEQVDISDRDFI